MSALRSENLRGDPTGKRSEIVLQIKAQIVAYLRAGSFNPSETEATSSITRRLAEIFNIIRQDERDFPELHGSDVAQLFSPPVFRNRKEAPGYFWIFSGYFF